MRARRQLLDVGEDLGELEVVESLLLEERQREAVEHVAVVVDHLVGLVVGLLDEHAHLLVDALGDALGEVATVTHVAAHEHLARRRAELDGADLGGHAVLGDHLAGDRGRLLDVVGFPGRKKKKEWGLVIAK